MSVRIAHRGYRRISEENSLAAIEHAAKLGCDLVEVDVRRRADGALVLDHDRADRPGAPLLSDALELLAGTTAGADLDLKAGGLGPDVVATVRAAGMLGRTVCTGGDWDQLAAIARAEPGIRVGLTIPRTTVNVPHWVQRFVVVQRRAWARRVPELLARHGANLIAAHWQLVYPGLVKAVHGAGAELWCWTVDEPRALAHLRALGVDGICSDHPESHGLAS